MPAVIQTFSHFTCVDQVFSVGVWEEDAFWQGREFQLHELGALLVQWALVRGWLLPALLYECAQSQTHKAFYPCCKSSK